MSITYNSPVCTFVLSHNVPVTAAASLTLSGHSFGVVASSLSSSLGSTLCSCTRWLSVSAASCLISPGASRSLRSAVSVFSLLATHTNTFTYNAPVLTVAAARNAPVCGGASVTLLGCNFAVVDPSPSATLPPFICATSSWISRTLTRCLTSPSTGPLWRVALFVHDLVGTTTAYFTHDAPLLSALPHTMANLPSTAGSSVTIRGFNFGVIDISLSVTLGSTLCATSHWVSQTSVFCASQPGSSSRLSARVSVTSLTGSAVLHFTYNSPVISWLAAFNGPSTGRCSLTLSGDHFGVESYSPSLAIGSTLSLTSSWRSASSVIGMLAPASSLALRANLDVHALVGTKIRLFTADVPLVTWVAPANVPSTGTGLTKITLLGKVFGVRDSSASALIGSTLCGTSLWVSVSAILCKAQFGESRSIHVTVAVAGLAGTATSVFTYSAPFVTDVELSNSPTTGGASLTLVGTNLGVTALSPSSSMGSSICGTASWISVTSITCRSQPGSSLRLRVALGAYSLFGTSTQMFSFASPSVTWVDVMNAPSSGVASITLSATNLAVLDQSPSMHFGPSLCLTTSWMAVTSLRCLLRKGEGLQVHVAATVDLLVGTATTLFTFDGPVLTFSEPTNSPLSGQALFTLTGLNFGVINVSPSASVASSVCSSVAWVSTSSLKCAAASGFSHELRGNIFVLSQLVTQTRTFSYDAPVLTLVTPANHAVTGRSSITLKGNSFGGADSSPSVGVGHSRCQTSRWTSRSSVTCFLLGGSGSRLKAVMGVSSAIYGTKTYSFTYSASIVSHVASTNAPPSGHASITLTGNAFGVRDSSLSGALASPHCITNRWLSHSSFVCLAPAKSSLSNRATVEIARTVSTFTAAFTFNAGFVTFVNPRNSPSTALAGITLYGTNFAADALSPSASLGSTMCATTRWVSPSTLLCQISSGSSVSLQAVVAQFAQLGTRVRMFSYNAAVVTHAYPFNAPPSRGGSLTLSALSFGTVDYSVSLALGSTLCVTSLWFSSTSIACRSATGHSTRLTLSIDVATLVATKTSTFSYDSPVITEAYDVNIPVTSGASLTLLGTSFGLVDISLSAAIGSSTCATSVWSSNSGMLCRPYAGVGRRHHATVGVAALFGTHTNSMSFASPVVTSLQPQNTPLQVPARLTLSGSHFGGIDYSLSGAIGSSLCRTSSWGSSSSVLCTTAPGVSSSLRASVILLAFAGTLTGVFSHDAPLITHAYLTNIPTSGGSVVTLQGRNFGAADLSPSAHTGPTVCGSTLWISDTGLRCTSGSGTSSRLRLVVSHANVAGTRTVFLTYDSPYLSGVMPTNRPMHGELSSLSIFGSNFGHSAVSPSAILGPTLCSTTAWASQSSILCGLRSAHSDLAPTDAPGVVFSVSALLHTRLHPLTFDSPLITVVRPFNAGGTSGTSLTLSGDNFGKANLSPSMLVSATVCSTSSWQSATSVKCRTPSGVADNRAMTLQTFLLVGTRVKSFSYNAPSVTWFQGGLANAPSIGHASITLAGVNYGSALYSPSVSVGFSACLTSSWVSSSSVSCLTPPGRSAHLHVSAVMSALVGTHREAFTYNAPLISALAAGANAPDSGAASITLFGFNFGVTFDRDVSATLASATCITVGWASVSSLVCHVRSSAANKLSLPTGVKSGSLRNSAAALFSYDTPLVSSAYPPNGPENGGTYITIAGANMGNIDSTPTGVVSSFSQPCITTAWIASSAVICLTDSHPADFVRVDIRTDNGLQGHLPHGFRFDQLPLPTPAPTPAPTYFCDMATTCSSHGSCSSEGLCLCFPAFQGSDCARCAQNRFGAACGAYCEASETCSGHGVCQFTTGSCICFPTWTLANCSQCAVPYFGTQCATYCVAATTCFGNGVCDQNGGCACDERHNGTNCLLCAINHYGSACEVVCVAESSCFGHGECSVDGRCQCFENFDGSDCTVCQPGWYLTDCSAFCSAASTCTAHGECTSIGACLCNTGFAGLFCDRCAPDHYTFACDVFCASSTTCSGHGSCNQFSGTCLCDVNYFLTGCSRFCSAPLNCTAREICSSSGTCVCSPAFMPFNGTCVCKPGWYGPNCDIHCTDAVTCGGRGNCTQDGNCACTLPFIGPGATPPCSLCVPHQYGSRCNVYCEVGVNCDAPSTCSPTGVCECVGHATPPLCSLCHADWYGSDCSSYCSARTNCSSHGSCSPVDGVCLCSTGFVGTSCDRCSSDLFGPNCDTFCNSQASCFGHGICDVSGLCSCFPRFTGVTCQLCAATFYNTSCDVFCLALTSCQGHGACGANGQCVCAVHFTGGSCSTCEANYFGSACSKFCSASSTCAGHGLCQSDGSCLCSGQHTGSDCRQCNTNFFTATCDVFCNPVLSCSGHGSCGVLDGTCACDAHFAGAQCSTCATDFYGPTCDIECSNSTCSHHGWCDPSKLQCVCDGHFSGTACDVCQPGYFGALCATFCQSNTTCSQRGVCDFAGACSCNARYSGADCSACHPDWAWSANCSVFCSAALTCNGHGTCQQGGACLCYPAWTGLACTKCAVDWFTVSCTAYCNAAASCSSHGSCSVDGVCVCDGQRKQPDCAVCKDNFAEPNCTVCVPGKVGAACQLTCSPTIDCAGHGVCDAQARCVCDALWAPPNCQACVQNRFGASCGIYCQSSTTCNGRGACSSSGTCVCTGNFAGVDCIDCVSGHFGQLCQDRPTPPPSPGSPAVTPAPTTVVRPPLVSVPPVTALINPSEQLVFFATVSSDRPRNLVYTWSVQSTTASSAPDLKDPTITLASPALKDLGLHPYVLVGGKKYVFEIMVSDPLVASQTVTVFTNAPPSGLNGSLVGQLTGTPLRGELLLTLFTLTASGWSDTHTPLSYRFSYRLASEETLLCQGMNETAISIIPLSGIVVVVLEVLDSLGAVSSPVELSLTVTRPTDTSPSSAFVSDVLNSVNTSNADQALLVTTGLANLLNQPDNTTARRQPVSGSRSRIDLRGTLVSTLSAATLNSIAAANNRLTAAEVKRITQAVDMVIFHPHEVDAQSQITSLRLLQTLLSTAVNSTSARAYSRASLATSALNRLASAARLSSAWFNTSAELTQHQQDQFSAISEAVLSLATSFGLSLISQQPGVAVSSPAVSWRVDRLRVHADMFAVPFSLNGSRTSIRVPQETVTRLSSDVGASVLATLVESSFNPYGTSWLSSGVITLSLFDMEGGALGELLVLSNLTSLVELQLTAPQATAARRLLQSDTLPRQECHYWDSDTSAWSSLGCVTLPNPRPPSARIEWRSNFSISDGPLTSAWTLVDTELMRDCADQSVFDSHTTPYRVFSGLSCPLTMPDNAADCYWDVLSQTFVGYGCAQAEVQCKCTRLAPFAVHQQDRPLSTSPYSERAVPTNLLWGEPLLPGALAFLLGAALVLAMVAHGRLMWHRQHILRQLLNPIDCGHDAETGVWTFGETAKADAQSPSQWPVKDQVRQFRRSIRSKNSKPGTERAWAPLTLVDGSARTPLPPVGSLPTDLNAVERAQTATAQRSRSAARMAMLIGCDAPVFADEVSGTGPNIARILGIPYYRLRHAIPYFLGLSSAHRAECDRVVGTALVLAFIENYHIESKAQVRQRRKLAADSFGNIYPAFDEVVQRCGVLLRNMQEPGWYERGSLWNLVFLQQQDGSWLPTQEVADALRAPHADSLMGTLPAQLRPLFAEEAERVWTTLLACAMLEHTGEGWLSNLSSRGKPVSMVTAAYNFFGTCSLPVRKRERFFSLFEALREAALTVVVGWHAAHIEEIHQEMKAKAVAQAADDSSAIGNAVVAFLSVLRASHGLLRVLAGPLNDEFTALQRVGVRLGSLLAMLSTCTALWLLRSSDCCAALHAHYQCADPLQALLTPCLVAAERGCASFMLNFAEVRADALPRGVSTLAAAFECQAFPNIDLPSHLLLVGLMAVTAAWVVRLGLPAAMRALTPSIRRWLRPGFLQVLWLQLLARWRARGSVRRSARLSEGQCYVSRPLTMLRELANSEEAIAVPRHSHTESEMPTQRDGTLRDITPPLTVWSGPPKLASAVLAPHPTHLGSKLSVLPWMLFTVVLSGLFALVLWLAYLLLMATGELDFTFMFIWLWLVLVELVLLDIVLIALRFLFSLARRRRANLNPDRRFHDPAIPIPAVTVPPMLPPGFDGTELTPGETLTENALKLAALVQSQQELKNEEEEKEADSPLAHAVDAASTVKSSVALSVLGPSVRGQAMFDLHYDTSDSD